MKKLTRGDLLSLEKYAEARPEFRAQVIERKKLRRVAVGPNATLYFEDKLTIRYQIQEMLRAEKMFEPEEIQNELDTYNPLIPDGSNWKATFMLEYEDPEERGQALARMIGIEETVAVQVEGFEPVYAIADEDLERATEEKTSSVHFLRFELTPEMAAAVKRGAGVGIRIGHDAYRHSVPAVDPATRTSLAADLE